MENENSDSDSDNWIAEQLSISRFYNESKIKEKQTEIENNYIKNDQTIVDREKHYFEKISKIQGETAKLRSTIAYLETDLNNINGSKDEFLLKNRIETLKSIDDINLDIKQNEKTISELINSIKEQRNHYKTEFEKIKKEKEENIENLNQTITELHQEIDEMDIMVRSPNPEMQSIYEMQCTAKMINIDIEETHDSINSLQRQINREQSNIQRLNEQLEYAEQLSSSIRQEITTIRESSNE